ncbi:SRPBCC family protein [Dyella telluris]|uniref:SRPBCC domain-containing protein n=1 Tax=Dyella telluris TaxID=2763498 RepID=A0A7G8Q9H6_9GAMM|nr:SRPBCC domain-containing protein [Dyella telluris]QNK03434.1 SRPBCC domain-containing protein [Dyella telluris]
MRHQTLAAAVLFSWVSLGAHAEVKEAAPDHLLIQDNRTIHAPPDKLYAALTDVGHWWNSEHTYSGDASHLSLKAEAGGCFCERWAGQSVEHGRVIWAAPGHVLRLDTALGPLQSLAVNGVMTFTLKPAPEGTALQFDYRVNGSGASGLDKIATAANGMLMDQLERLQRYAEKGKP